MKSQASTPRRRTAAPQFWVIDTDTPGMSHGEFSARGPYPTQKAAEAAIRADARNLWEDSCACLQSETDIPWSKPLHVVQVIRTVQPEITANVTLVNAPVENQP